VRRPLRTSAALVAALAAALAGGCPSAASEPRALLWSVSDADNTVYLLGSFHALRADDYPLDPAVDAALADAEQLAFELSPTEMESPDLPAMMLRAATLPAGEDLRSTLPPATFAKLEAYAQSRGLPLPALMQREPWFVALLVSLGEMQRIGLDPAQGLDRKLMAQAAAAGKPGTGLETAAEQLAALDSMTPAEQQQALDEALTGVDDMRQEMDELHDLWRRGDADALYSKMGTELRDRYPLLYQRINVDRNSAWLPKVQAMLDGEREKDALVVVGSLHLLGDEGLVARLKAKGYKVERLPRG
jgi:uncharacterized protein YbaP (TraB family)